ncbi:hypothetical protein [Panacagrimonas sp.]|uniref:hypothetical protein n=1 Tax=Panacagrimonas sp. TaxID=2480088 RepID=UPI003B52CB2E
MNPDRQIAIGDLVLFTPLALPGVGLWIVTLLLQFNAALDWPGVGSSDALAGLLVNLLGLFGVCFALIRLHLGAAQMRRFAIGVKAGAVVLITTAVISGAPAILMLIAAADLLAVSVLTGCAWRERRRARLER